MTVVSSHFSRSILVIVVVERDKRLGDVHGVKNGNVIAVGWILNKQANLHQESENEASRR